MSDILFDCQFEDVFNESSHIEQTYLRESLSKINKATVQLRNVIKKKTLLVSDISEKTRDIDEFKELFIKRCNYTTYKLYIEHVQGLLQTMEKAIQELETNQVTIVELMNPKEFEKKK